MSDITTTEIEERNQEYLKGLQGNIGKYLSFLSTMARFHKYEVADLTNFVLKAPAMFTAVASKELWAKLFHRKISSNAKGVTLIKDGKKTVYYDVSETESIDKKPIPVNLWQYNDTDHKKFINAVVAGESKTERQLKIIAEELANRSSIDDNQNNSAYDFEEMDEEEEILPTTIEKQNEVEIPPQEDSQAENISSEQSHEENFSPETPTEDVMPDLQTILAEDMAVIRGNSIEKNIFRKNVTAIRTLQQIEREKRPATPEELQALKEYAGFGGIPKAFDKNDPNWNREAWLLQSMLTDKEYNAARASTLNAHYTSGEIVQGIYSGLENLGFNGGTILEPSMGVGGFFGNMPDEMKNYT